MARAIEHPVTATIANDYSPVDDARTNGRPVVGCRPRSAVARDLRILTGRLLGEPERRGVLSWA